MNYNRIYVVVAVVIILAVLISFGLSGTNSHSSAAGNTTAISAVAGGAPSPSVVSNLSGALNISQPQDINYTSNQNVSGPP